MDEHSNLPAGMAKLIRHGVLFAGSSPAAAAVGVALESINCLIALEQALSCRLHPIRGLPDSVRLDALLKHSLDGEPITAVRIGEWIRRGLRVHEGSVWQFNLWRFFKERGIYSDEHRAVESACLRTTDVAEALAFTMLRYGPSPAGNRLSMLRNCDVECSGFTAASFSDIVLQLVTARRDIVHFARGESPVSFLRRWPQMIAQLKALPPIDFAGLLSGLERERMLIEAAEQRVRPAHGSRSEKHPVR
jgi:hypothetical protein